MNTVSSIQGNFGDNRSPAESALAVDLKRTSELISVSEKTVLREIQRGHLKGIKIGRLWRVRIAEIQSYLKRKEGLT